MSASIENTVASLFHALEVREIARHAGGVGTVGRVVTRPGIVTAIAGRCEITLDQRHLDGTTLAAMLAEARSASEEIAAEERVAVEWERIWRIDPVHFHPGMIDTPMTRVHGGDLAMEYGASKIPLRRVGHLNAVVARALLKFYP